MNSVGLKSGGRIGALFIGVETVEIPRSGRHALHRSAIIAALVRLKLHDAIARADQVKLDVVCPGSPNLKRASAGVCNLSPKS
jgi:hypothetical protein